MRENTSRPTQRSARRPEVWVAHGYGLKIHVRSRHLVIEDGLGRERRTRRVARATVPFNRLIVLGHSGFISLDAFRWLWDLKIPLVQIDRDGMVIACSVVDGLKDANLRRRQAVASGSVAGLEISKTLIGLKIDGQRRLLQELWQNHAIAVQLADIATTLPAIDNVIELRHAEASAAALYWAAWRDHLELKFTKPATRVFPAHWFRFDRRSSLLTGAPRSATDPTNALLNYSYALLEAEARVSLLKVGLDPGIGMLHADQGSRDSMALDVMEPIRPSVDRGIVELVRRQRFGSRDFLETSRGICRLSPSLLEGIATVVGSWIPDLLWLVESVAQQIGDDRRQLPTILSGRNRRTGRGLPAPEKEPHFGKPVLDQRCVCDAVIPATRRLCDNCSHSRMLVSGQVGKRSDVDAAIRRGNAIAERWAETKAWRGSKDPADAEIFRRDVWPGIKWLPVPRIVAATGLSHSYCSRIRQGRVVPHPRHWESLKAVGGGDRL